MKNKGDLYSLGSDIADVVGEFDENLKAKIPQQRHMSAYSYARIVEQFATAVIWSTIYPGVQPPSICENRSEK
jgi:hypothetical protein